MSYQDKLFLIISLSVIVLSIIGTIIYRHNRLKHQVNEPPSGFHKTNEIFINPTTGINNKFGIIQKVVNDITRISMSITEIEDEIAKRSLPFELWGASLILSSRTISPSYNFSYPYG